MLRVVIVEDEQSAIENLLRELRVIQDQLSVVGVLRSVQKSIAWFKANDEDIDLIFMDIELGDGISFDIFKSVNMCTPVIFTTAYDMYLQTCLEYNGIDYLLKPISREKLNQSITKFNNLKKHFTGKTQDAHSFGAMDTGSLFKDRIVVKKGIEFQSIKAEDVAFIYTEHKLVFIVDKDGRKYMAHANNLTDLMLHLNRKVFYRANRKYIININFIRKYKPFDRVKVEVELSIQSPESIVISQENSSGFRHWIENL